ncbi:pyrroline-5-carboxylate reductase [Szabonella alba]|uniref:Pyrroline-5-carboxylate reductase n=1 Tax=Szabonella alba TaxID=2804194 RepID=A0A8K0Y1C3_9RHOB|nr:pyrroline-5-carboxylate reductase [Szabonella alba]MBL4917988.1 pyrroline-5-carboxylate reductase [Szabonella alba]
MDMERVNARGLVLLGCGKMGSALLAGWLARGLKHQTVTVLDPNPSDWLQAQGIRVNGPVPARPAVVVLAVKPQMMGEALPLLAPLGQTDALILSVAAGTTLARFETVFGPQAVLVRAMPNTPAAVGRGITAIVGNARAGEADLALAESLLSAVGEVVRLQSESQMDAVTGLSGSGPAYVFHLIEAMAAAGEAQGLAPDLAMRLARATVCGAGELAHQTPETSAAQLRINVTSPGGTTAAGLSVLMDPKSGFPDLLRRAVAAATERGRELGQ